VFAALTLLSQEYCPAVPEDARARADMARRLIRRFDSVERRHRSADDRTRFLDLVRAVDAHPRDAECVAERIMAALGHPVPGMGIHRIGGE
jgi:hypothetical protein